MQVKAVDFIMYGVSNMDKAVAFFRDVLGLKLEHDYQGGRGDPGRRGRAGQPRRIDGQGHCCSQAGWQRKLLTITGR
jgi:catechol 2,3-dioxygenase-like lactoylglutathione lyase family enzyme